MPFPAQWPPRVSTGVRSLRFFRTGTATTNFADSAWMFLDAANVFTPSPFVQLGSPAPTNNPLTPTGTGAQGVATGITASDPPMVWSGNIRICNDGAADLEFSFDGVAVHGRIKPNEAFVYRNRYEAGISVRGAGGSTTYRVEAW